MRIMKNGISKNIDISEWNFYSKLGWRKVGCSEPQPSQENLYVIDDYTIGRLECEDITTP